MRSILSAGGSHIRSHGFTCHERLRLPHKRKGLVPPLLTPNTEGKNPRTKTKTRQQYLLCLVFPVRPGPLRQTKGTEEGTTCRRHRTDLIYRTKSTQKRQIFRMRRNAERTAAEPRTVGTFCFSVSRFAFSTGDIARADVQRQTYRAHHLRFNCCTY